MPNYHDWENKKNHTEQQSTFYIPSVLMLQSIRAYSHLDYDFDKRQISETRQVAHLV